MFKALLTFSESSSFLTQAWDRNDMQTNIDVD